MKTEEDEEQEKENETDKNKEKEKERKKKKKSKNGKELNRIEFFSFFRKPSNNEWESHEAKT